MAKSSLKVGLLSVLAAGAVGAATLEEDFRDPPREAGLWAWWHWQGNNVTRKGITLDLEAMRDSGLAGATIFTIAEHAGLGVLSNRVNKVMAYRNEEWWGLIAFAVAEAERLGLRIGMHNSPGFSVTGGPWIDPAHAMQKVTWTRRAVAGGERLKGAALQQPWACLGFYRDIAVLAVSDGAAVPVSDVLDLTNDFRDGVLNWQAPVGRNWTVYRFGSTPTGQRTHPVPDEIRKTCLETDKLSREATELHIRTGLEPLKARLGRSWGTTFNQITVDSYEAGKQNWSPCFREEFKKLVGYDPVPFLPVLDGRVVESPPRTQEFRADMDFVVRRLFALNYHEVLHDWARKNGVELHLEPYGGAFDFCEASARATCRWWSFGTACRAGLETSRGCTAASPAFRARSAAHWGAISSPQKPLRAGRPFPAGRKRRAISSGRATPRWLAGSTASSCTTGYTSRSGTT